MDKTDSMTPRSHTAKPHRILYGLILSALIVQLLVPALRVVLSAGVVSGSSLDFTQVDHPRGDGKEPPRAPARKPLRLLPAHPAPDGFDCRAAGLIPSIVSMTPPVHEQTDGIWCDAASIAAVGVRLLPLRRAPPALDNA